MIYPSMVDFLKKSLGVFLAVILPLNQALTMELRAEAAVAAAAVTPISVALTVPSAPPDEPPMRINMTVPKVDEPKTALAFSTRPTAQEFFRARIFEEPLVLVGASAATAGENAALAATLLGYAKRSSPDDLSSLEASPCRPGAPRCWSTSGSKLTAPRVTPAR